MKPKAILLTIVGIAALLAAGCAGAPKEDPAKFVGEWLRYYAEGEARTHYPQGFALSGDGKGQHLTGQEPYPEEVTWLIYRNQFVITPRDGTRKTSFDFRFNGPDELILTPAKGGAEMTFRRVQEPPPGSEEQPSD